MPGEVFQCRQFHAAMPPGGIQPFPLCVAFRSFNGLHLGLLFLVLRVRPLRPEEMKERQRAMNRPLSKDAPTAKRSIRMCRVLSSHLVALGLQLHRDATVAMLDRDVLCRPAH
jgi:hypothetical protein